MADKFMLVLTDAEVGALECAVDLWLLMDRQAPKGERELNQAYDLRAVKRALKTARPVRRAKKGGK